MYNLLCSGYLTRMSPFKAFVAGADFMGILGHRKPRQRWVQIPCPRLRVLSWNSNPRNVVSKVHTLSQQTRPSASRNDNALSKTDVIKIPHFPEMRTGRDMERMCSSVSTQRGLSVFSLGL